MPRSLLPRTLLLVGFVLLLMLPGAWAAAACQDMPVYRIEVAGLACPFCAYGIEKKLLELDGVDQVEVHLGEGVVLVTMTTGRTLDEATAAKAVADAGFRLDGFAPVPPGSCFQ